ncbi:MAG: hypothetical protein IPN95_23145 [Bacteroidetes bacterium]|nr:hypothetical protein [Bacteroidota bacterium]
MSRIQFGGKITQELLERYALSPNWRDGSFQNLEATSMSMSPFKIPQIIYKQFTNRADKAPKKP